jgi:hypothetical protein
MAHPTSATAYRHLLKRPVPVSVPIRDFGDRDYAYDVMPIPESRLTRAKAERPIVISDTTKPTTVT